MHVVVPHERDHGLVGGTQVLEDQRVLRVQAIVGAGEHQGGPVGGGQALFAEQPPALAGHRHHGADPLIGHRLPQPALPGGDRLTGMRSELIPRPGRTAVDRPKVWTQIAAVVSSGVGHWAR